MSGDSADCDDVFRGDALFRRDTIRRTGKKDQVCRSGNLRRTGNRVDMSHRAVEFQKTNDREISLQQRMCRVVIVRTGRELGYAITRCILSVKQVYRMNVKCVEVGIAACFVSRFFNPRDLLRRDLTR